jgi:hypothetical protein
LQSGEREGERSKRVRIARRGERMGEFRRSPIQKETRSGDFQHAHYRYDAVLNLVDGLYLFPKFYIIRILKRLIESRDRDIIKYIIIYIIL